MTSKQYYKQTSDMAYPLKDFAKDDKNPNKVIANIALTHGETRNDALKILDDNDFFSLPSDFDFDGIDTNEIELEIRFHYGIDDFDCFKVDVCDIIDCTVVDGGRIVLSCEGYELTKVFRPRTVASTSDHCNKKSATDGRKSIFDLFDDIVGCSSCLNDLFNFPSFPKFPDITKMIEETRKNFEKGIDKSNNAKFYNFSCKIDPDGKVHIKRSSNDGTVEKEFKLGDSSSSSNAQPKKIEIKGDDNLKTELKNLIK
jgi:hypothetical protein